MTLMGQVTRLPGSPTPDSTSLDREGVDTHPIGYPLVPSQNTPSVRQFFIRHQLRDSN